MASSVSTLRVPGLRKSKLAKLRAQARILGMSAEGYAKQLIEEGIALEQQARSTSFDELFASVQRAVSEKAECAKENSQPWWTLHARDTTGAYQGREADAATASRRTISRLRSSA